MRRAITIFMIVAFAALAVVMFFYWQRETNIVKKGVLISNELKVQRIL